MPRIADKDRESAQIFARDIACGSESARALGRPLHRQLED